MKLISWNVRHLNDHLDAFEFFVSDRRTDVFAFQELTERHIDVLRTMEGYELYLAEDFIERENVYYLGLPASLNESNHQVWPINRIRRVSGSLIGRRNAWVECLSPQSLTVLLDDPSITIAKVHLSAASSPIQRALHSGDIVLVDLSRKPPAPPGIFVLFDGMGIVAERLENISDNDPPKVRIISDNTFNSAYERTADEVNIIGRIRWFAREI
ncbi:MAG: S24 family peptidase [Albidovulum sp.]|nr:S24 family peptidase [Albidovulum sp.]